MLLSPRIFGLCALLALLCCLLCEQPAWSVIEAEDGSVCFSNCNGHGTCIDYACHCHVGYHGDACDTTFIREGQEVLPILSQGHFNISRKNFTQIVTKNKLVLVGFSSPDCHKCITAEYEYVNVSARLKELKIPFGRVNAADGTMKSIAQEHGVMELPALILFQNHRPLVYRGYHHAESILSYVDKVRGPPTFNLKTVDDVTRFLANRTASKYAVSTAMVIGFFSDHEGIEEDEYNDFVDAAKLLQTRENIQFGVVTKPSTVEWFKKNKTIDRSPSMLLVGDSGEVKTINLNELFGDGEGINEWIVNNAAPLVGKLTSSNFQLYEKTNKPMLMLFLDLTHEDSASTPGVVGGRSGGLLNEVLLGEFREAAKEHSDRVVFVYLDGVQHADQMRSLGLYGGAERLPSLAFNTRDNSKIPFSESLPINKDTLLQFIADFLSGKLRSAADAEEAAKKQLLVIKPRDYKNLPQRKEVKPPPEQKRGISEQFGDGTQGDKAVVKVSLANFDKVAMQEDKDVVLLLYAKNCESCSHFAVYFKKMGERFADLGLNSLIIGRMDVTDETPPPELNLMQPHLPTVVILPAYAKHAPWSYYSGVGKVRPMMYWVQQQAAIKFDLPNLPHLTPDEREAYKVQIREREELLEKRKRDEEREMENENKAQKALAAKKRKQQQKLQEEEQEQEQEQDEHVISTIDSEVAASAESSQSKSIHKATEEVKKKKTEDKDGKQKEASKADKKDRKKNEASADQILKKTDKKTTAEKATTEKVKGNKPNKKDDKKGASNKAPIADGPRISVPDPSDPDEDGLFDHDEF